MGRITALLRWIDAFQRRHQVPGFGYAVLKKFSDDNAGNLAALLAYYAFFSIFPLLLVLVTVLGLVLHGDPHLQTEVLNSGLRDFPVIGQQLRTNVHSLTGNGLGLAVGIIGTFLGARGVASAAQNAFNSIWAVPRTHRPSFPFNQLRSIGIVGVFGGGLLISASAQTFIGSVHPHGAALGVGTKVAAYAGATVLNLVVFCVGFRLATAAEVPTRRLLRGAVAAALVWEVLEAAGGLLINHQLRNSSSVYGTFGLVIGLISWFYLQAELTFYAVEADTVRALKLWPRSLKAPPLTDADRRAYDLYAGTEQRRKEQRITVSYLDPDDASAGEPAGGEQAQREPAGRESAASEPAATGAGPAGQRGSG